MILQKNAENDTLIAGISIGGSPAVTGNTGWEHYVANAIVVLHLLFVVFVLLGGLLVVWRRWIMWIHLPSMCWGILIEFSGWVCPLTPLEKSLRERAGLTTYSGDFVSQYIIPVLYPEHLTRTIQIIFGTAVIGINFWIYWRLFRCKNR